MHLSRIQVPNYRVLKDVDISFEKDFIPKIFPLGSLNGGGKSTLLQLIFMLLHCSPHPERHEYLKNMLSGFGAKDDTERKTLAILDIWDGEKEVRLEFFSCTTKYISLPDTNNDQYLEDISFFTSGEFMDHQGNLYRLQEEQEQLQGFLQIIDDSQNIEDTAEQLDFVRQETEFYNNLNFSSLQSNFLEKLSQAFPIDSAADFDYDSESYYLFHEIIGNIKQQIKFHLQRIISEQEKILEEQNNLYLSFKQWIVIFNYVNHKNSQENDGLLYCVENIEIDQAESFLKQLSEKVFLAAPITQVFLFMPKDITKLIFKTSNQINDYHLHIQQSKSQLSGIFYYDFSVVDFLIKSFKAARDKDFEQVTKTGSYGNHYHTLIEQLNSVLQNKRINVDPDLSGINFKMTVDGEEIELYPEDLSHGELKRLSIYVWLKSCNIENAIILMDEIEIAFHPDWQYQIIKDLETWGASNQYILATHSYELCQALTPSHVKELEPKLFNN